MTLAIGNLARAGQPGAGDRIRDDLVFDVPFRFGPGGWKVGNRQVIPNVLEIMEFIPEVDDIRSWRQMFTVQNFTNAWGGPTPQASLDQLKNIREQTCPGVTRWNVIASDAVSIVFEWSLSAPCLEQPIQHEISKIIYGRFNRFLIRYTLKADQMPAETRRMWIEKLSGARVETH